MTISGSRASPIPGAVRLGYLFAFASAVFAGLIPVIAKALLPLSTPLTVSALTFIVAGALVLPLRPKERPTKRSAGWMLASGALGAALAPALYLYGVDQTQAVNAALLANAEVFFTGVIAYAAFKERLTRNQLAESLLVIAGVVIVTTGLNPGSLQLLSGVGGNLLIIVASFVWSVDNNISRITSGKFGPIFVSKFRNLFGGGLLLAFLLATSTPIVVGGGAPLLILGYGVDIGLATLTFMAALTRIGAVRTILVFSTSSIFGPAFAIALLGETVNSGQLIGGGLILLGVYLVQRSEEHHGAAKS